VYNEEQKVVDFAKTTAFILFIMLLSSYFDKELVILLLLSLIYMQMRE